MKENGYYIAEQKKEHKRTKEREELIVKKDAAIVELIPKSVPLKQAELEQKKHEFDEELQPNKDTLHQKELKEGHDKIQQNQIAARQQEHKLRLEKMD